MIRFFLFVFVSVLAGCSNDKQISKIAAEIDVIAVVGGEEITSDDLNVASLRSLRTEFSELSEEMQDRLLDSVISTMAMSQIAQSAAHPDQKGLLDASVSAYRDELWVKEYLKENAIPQPVSNKQVEDYYTSHPEYFGGGDVVDYMHISCRYGGGLKISDCTKLLIENNIESWNTAAKNNADVSVVNASLNTLLERDNISQLVLSTLEQEFSEFKNTESQLNRIFVIKKRTLKPKPLITVQKEIRERLAPLQLKKSIKEASERARSNIKVVLKK